MFSRSKSCRGNSQSLVAGIARWRETNILKPIDKCFLGRYASQRAVTKVNVDVASKLSNSEGRACNWRAKTAWLAETD